MIPILTKCADRSTGESCAGANPHKARMQLAQQVAHQLNANSQKIDYAATQ